MENFTTYDLPCYDGRQSFYGKARIIETTEGKTLQSYNTYICTIGNDGKLTKLDPVVTNTTRRHIRSFLRFCNFPAISNRDWDKLPLHTKVGREAVA